MKAKSKRNKKAVVAPARLNIGQRAQEVSRLLTQVEASVGSFRKATLGDDVAPVPAGDGNTNLESIIINVQTRLESLVRETRRINLRLGQ